MSNLAEYYRLLDEKEKQRRAKRNEKWEPLLIEAGATKKAAGIYELLNWFCYPTKGFAMNKYDKEKIRLSRFFKRFREGLE